MSLAFIGIGSNLGESVQLVRQAIAGLASFGTLLSSSSLYRSDPWGKTDQPPFINAAACLETSLEPLALLEQLQMLEARLGRKPGERWGPRAIDLDILTYDDARVALPNLQIPHRHLYERAFVLIPLAEIAPFYEAARDALPRSEIANVTLIQLQPG